MILVIFLQETLSHLKMSARRYQILDPLFPTRP